MPQLLESDRLLFLLLDISAATHDSDAAVASGSCYCKWRLGAPKERRGEESGLKVLYYEVKSPKAALKETKEETPTWLLSRG